MGRCGVRQSCIQRQGRRLGKGAFLVTLLLDALKGALAVWGGQALQLGENAMIATIAAVAIGHNWPLQLRFRGGKGVAVSLGALTAYEPGLLLVLLAIFLPLFVLVRSFTLAGLLAFSLAPLVVFLRNWPMMAVAALSVIAILLLIGHQRNIREEIARIFLGRSVKETPTPPNKGAAP